MFSNFKEKLHGVQENLTASIRGLSANDVALSGTEKTLYVVPLNFAAGSDVLERFQANWAEIHAQTILNGKQAHAADELIRSIHKRLQADWKTAQQANSVLSQVPKVILEIDLLSERLRDLDDLFVGVEKSLIKLEDLIETRNLQDRQLDHRFQLALYKEKKLSHLENTRVTLAREHAEKVALHEARQQRVKRERQEAFEQQFKQDLNVYKETNNIPKVATLTSRLDETKLEEVVLEAENTAELDEFLDDQQVKEDSLQSSA